MARYPWSAVKKLIGVQLKNVVEAYRSTSEKPPDLDGESFEERYSRASKFIDDFPWAPFTLQRMCELLVEPRRYYSNLEKFFLAFTKV